jgi:hypothetical protein
MVTIVHMGIRNMLTIQLAMLKRLLQIGLDGSVICEVLVDMHNVLGTLSPCALHRSLVHGPSSHSHEWVSIVSKTATFIKVGSFS